MKTYWIESDRLYFRKMEEKDFDEVARILRDKQVEYIWEMSFTDDDVREWIERRMEGYRKHGMDYLLAIEKATDEVVGQIGVLTIPIDGVECADIGYMLKEQYRGKGYATEGARRMCQYAFEELKVPKVVCDIRPVNQESIAVARRIGMEQTGSFIKRYRGLEREHLVFELSANK